MSFDPVFCTQKKETPPEEEPFCLLSLRVVSTVFD
jgi:hypothetical protein